MSDHEREGARGKTPGGASSSKRIELTPAQRAEEALALAGRTVSELEIALIGVQRATEANDLPTWTTKRHALDAELAEANRAIERAASGAEVEPHRIAELRTRYAVAITTASANAIPPRGFAAISIEAELLAAVRARPEGGYKVGLDRKEEALRVLLDRLDPVESRRLVARVNNPVPEDELAAAFRKTSNLGSERLARLLSFAKDAPRRAAIRAEVEDSLGPDPKASIRAEVDDSLALDPDGSSSTSPHDLIDGFNAAAARVGKDYRFPEHREPGLPTHEDAARYLHINNVNAWDDLRTYLAEVSWPDLADGIEWRSEPAFSEQLAVSLRRHLSGLGAEAVSELLYPHDLFAIIDSLRPDKGRLGWVPAVGVAFGQLVQRVGVAALRRVGPRLVAAVDERGDVDPSHVPLSHPMDGHVLAALRHPEVATIDRGQRPGTPKRAKRAIKLAWQGAKDPAMWRWVRAEPADATPEEVIEQLAAEPGGQDAWFADALAVAPPLFGVPAAWARTIPGAAAHAPKHLSTRELDPRTDTPEERLIALGGHAEADDLAHDAKPTGTPMSAAQVVDILADCSIQLGTIHKVVARWNLGELTTEALLRVSKKQAELVSGSPAEAASWGPIATGQRRRLHSIGDALHRVDGQVSKLGDKDRQGGGLGPVRAIVRMLGGAAATSHNGSASDALFAKAMQAQGELSIDSVQAQILDVAAASGVPTASHRWGAPASKDVTDQRLANEGEVAIADARVIQDRLINGRDVTTEEVGDATLAAQETAMRSRLNTLFVESGQLQVAAADAGSGATGKIAALFSSRFRKLGDVTKSLREHLDRITFDWTHTLQAGGTARPDGSAPPNVTDPTKRRAALAVAEKSYASIRDDHELMKFLADGQSIIEAQQFRKLCASLVAMIGVALVAQTAAGAVAESMGGAFLSAEGAAVVGELSAGARAVTVATSVAVDIGVNTVGQAALTDATMKGALIDNLVFAFGTRVIAGPMSAEVAEARAMARALDQEAMLAGVVERRLEGIASAELKALGWTAVKAAEITGETFTNAALVAIAGKLQGHPNATPQEARDWFMQALAVSVGKASHAAFGERLPSLERLAKRADATAAEKRLLADVTQLDQLAIALSRIGNAETALRILAERTRLLERELALVEWRARWAHDPEAKLEIDARHAELHGQLDHANNEAMVAIRLGLIGLEELIPGQTWRGTPEEVQRAAHELKAAQTWDPARRVTTLTVDGLTLEIYERPRPAGTAHAHQEAGAPRATHELGTELEMIPGSALRGAKPGSKEPSDAEQTALLDEASAVMPAVTVAADVNEIRPLGAHKFLVTLRDGTMTIIEVKVARIEDHDVARILPNSSRETQIGGRTAHGEHVIQLSAHLPVDQVERALAHAVARLTTVHERAVRGSFGDGPRDNAGQPVGMSSDAAGRLAELRVLVHQLDAHPDNAPNLRREILALADHLGVVGSEPAIEARRAQLEQALNAREREELERASRGDKDRSRAEKASLEEVREAARQDIADDLAREHQRSNDRPGQYDLAPGNKMSRADLARYAAAAARLRALESHRTLQRLRADSAKLGAGQYLRIEDVQLGGGLALAGRTPTSLLVDLRGRWQADGNADIAQTAQQLAELYRARFGDTRQVAGPNERVPLEAIRFWEDSIAAMGPVIDGGGALRMEGERMLLDIKPTDGSPGLTIEVGGTPTVATGFVPEAVPGAPRMNMVDVVTTMERQLRDIVDDAAVTAEVRDAAQVALVHLREVKTPRATDGALADALGGPHADELKQELRARDTGGKVGSGGKAPVKTKEALGVAESGKKWAELKQADAADGVDQIAFGDEANLEWRVTQMLAQVDGKLHASKDKPIRVVIAGAGGTAVSAAEMILARPNTTITMLGRDTPAGLLKNGQFMTLATTHADAALAKELGIPPGDGRLKMYLKSDINFDVPTPIANPDGTQSFQAYPSRDGHSGEFVGDIYVVSAGRAEQTPPIVSDLILQTQRAGGSVSYRGDFDADGQYTGYSVVLTVGRHVRELKVTGAASRYAPSGGIKAGRGGTKTAERMGKASGSGRDSNDAPAATGTFAGGAAASGVQGSRHASRDNAERPSQQDRDHADN